MVKFRGFSIVLHDSQKGNQGKTEVEARVKELNPRQYVIAEEDYNHQDGTHIHLFLQLHNAVSFKSMLTKWCTWYKSGRVQVDQMRGDISSSCKYILQDKSKKDKYFDPDPILYLDSIIATALQVNSSKILCYTYIPSPDNTVFIQIPITTQNLREPKDLNLKIFKQRERKHHQYIQLNDPTINYLQYISTTTIQGIPE